MKNLMLMLYCASLPLAEGNLISQASGQTIRPIGVVLTIDSAAKRVTIKTDGGPEMTIVFEEATRFLRVAPGAKDLENAAPVSAPELAVGDRILARGRNGGDPGSFVAASIIVMSKGDIARKHAAERAEWEKRGVGGMITAIDSAAKEITINPPTTAGAKPMVIAFAPGATLRRYAPNSVKFSDARPSRFEELKVGDQVKALGTANETRSRYMAEEMVAGSFRVIAGAVVSIDAAQNTFVTTTPGANKPMQAQVSAYSTVRRLSPEIAQMLAARNKVGNSLDQSPKDLQSLIEKLPPLTLTDLKPGDAIIFTFAAGEDASRITAITVLAGVEPLLKAPGKGGQSVNLGSWSLDLNMNVGLP